MKNRLLVLGFCALSLGACSKDAQQAAGPGAESLAGVWIAKSQKQVVASDDVYLILAANSDGSYASYPVGIGEHTDEINGISVGNFKPKGEGSLELEVSPDAITKYEMELRKFAETPIGKRLENNIEHLKMIQKGVSFKLQPSGKEEILATLSDGKDSEEDMLTRISSEDLAKRMALATEMQLESQKIQEKLRIKKDPYKRSPGSNSVFHEINMAPDYWVETVAQNENGRTNRNMRISKIVGQVSVDGSATDASFRLEIYDRVGFVRSLVDIVKEADGSVRLDI